MTSKVWKTKNGKEIPINKMTNQHLLNAMRMLEKFKRHMEGEAWAFVGTMNGEMASYYAEQQAEAFCDKSVEEAFPIYGGLLSEAYCRGLTDMNGRRLPTRPEKGG